MTVRVSEFRTGDRVTDLVTGLPARITEIQSHSETIRYCTYTIAFRAGDTASRHWNQLALLEDKLTDAFNELGDKVAAVEKTYTQAELEAAVERRLSVSLEQLQVIDPRRVAALEKATKIVVGDFVSPSVYDIMSVAEFLLGVSASTEAGK